MEKIDYKDYSDEKLVELSRSGDSGAVGFILTKYKNLVRSKARSYYLAGGDSDDLIQEGMIGLFQAIESYDEARETTFMTYASICINNKMMSAVTADQRYKNMPLNGYVSIYSTVENEHGETFVLSDVIPDEGGANPEDIVVGRENVRQIEDRMDELSNLEKEVLGYYMEGLSYADISKRTGKGKKSVENAIQRIRAKLKN